MNESLDRFKLLEKVIRISNSTVDIERRLQNILQLLRRELGLDRVVIFNLDRDSDSLMLRTTDQEGPVKETVVDLDPHFLGRAIAGRQPVLGVPDDLDLLPEEARDLYSGLDFTSAFPVMDDQALYGVLTLSYRHAWTPSLEWMNLLDTVCREIAGTIRNSRLYAESKKRIAELSVMYEVGRAVSSTLDLDKVLDTVVTIFCKVLQAGGCTINVLDTNTRTLRVAAEYGEIPGGCRLKHLLKSAGGQIPEEITDILTSDQPYLGPACGSVFAPLLFPEDCHKSTISLPVKFKGRFNGNLNLFNKADSPHGRPREFNREDLELLTTMATMIASSVENALTYLSSEEMARHNERLVKSLSCLYEISGAMMTTVKTDELLSIIAKALTMQQGLGFDRAVIFLMNEEEDALYEAAFREIHPEERKNLVLPLADALKPIPGDESVRPNSGLAKIHLPLKNGSGILVRAAQEKRSFLVTPDFFDPDSEHGLNFEFGVQSYAVVPMSAKGKVVGVIAVDRDFRSQDFSDEDMRNLSMLANQAGLAIENSWLYEYIEQAKQTLSQTKERLLEAEKLAALGELAAGMAHEIRNPLVSIGGFTRRLLKGLDHDSPHKVYIEVIINEVTRLEKTLSEVLEFSRDTLGHLEKFDLNDIIAESLFILRREFREAHIEVIKNLGEIEQVMVDERQIKHVFFNLFFNAQQAMGQGGTLSVTTYPTRIYDRAFVACEVSDTGPGIQAEILPNIFNPFFTTKDTGTGLGLSIVHKIISRHHGEIDVLNRPEGGASFVVKLPVAAENGLYLK